jgi:hypothetical protein
MRVYTQTTKGVIPVKVAFRHFLIACAGIVSYVLLNIILITYDLSTIPRDNVMQVVVAAKRHEWCVCPYEYLAVRACWPSIPKVINQSLANLFG